MNDIIAVFGTGPDSRYFLGYAIATSHEDIQQYFLGREGYGLETEKVVPVVIPSGYADRVKELRNKKKELQTQIDEINRQIKEPGE